MTKYSGQTTCIAHKNLNPTKDPNFDWSAHPNNGSAAIQTEVILYVQWTDCPVEVENDVRRLWRALELRNDANYSWDRDEEVDDAEGEQQTFAAAYPVLDEYLQARGYDKITINWWW